MDFIKETRIKDCLQALVNPSESYNSTQVVDNLHFLDTLVKEDKGQLPQKLKHYLQKRSYTKALDYLNRHKLGRSE